jgi:hypothetical protein
MMSYPGEWGTEAVHVKGSPDWLQPRVNLIT